jgi:hypothetical protein
MKKSDPRRDISRMPHPPPTMVNDVFVSTVPM